MPSEEVILDSHVLVIDADASNVRLLERLFESAGYKNVTLLTDPAQTFETCERIQPDIILLDLHMPKMDGYEILRRLKELWGGTQYVPILVFTADVDPMSRKMALELGAHDFLSKPGDLDEIVLRVRNFLETRHLHRQLQVHNANLEYRVQERTILLQSARLEAMERLARAAEFRDDDTGEHTKRVGDLSADIAAKLIWPEGAVEQLRLAAPLHDIGKIGIPDSILLKPSKLTLEELVVMKTHTTIGAEILRGSGSPVLQEAELIALSHHERWDGTGYPQGLQGEAIPLVARIVAVADVYDALVNERPYKQAWSADDAEAEIVRSAGTHFDPQVVQAFMDARTMLKAA